MIQDALHDSDKVRNSCITSFTMEFFSSLDSFVSFVKSFVILRVARVWPC